MKVGLIVLGTRGTPARYGGFETLAELLKHRLGNSTFRVQVPSTAPSPDSKFVCVTRKYLETVTGTLRESKKADRLIDFAVLVANPVNVLTALRMTRVGHSVVVHMDGRDDLRRKWPFPVRFLYRGCQRLCVWSGIPLVFDSWIVRSEIGGRNYQKHTVITYGGCEACELNREVWQCIGREKRFITLARAEPENQLVEIVRAVDAMAVPTQLQVVTTTRHRGKYWQKLEDEVERSSTAELIDGIWDKQQLCSLYREVSAVIHGHTVGGTNPSLVLALCHGTPVLAHDNPYNREVAGSLARYWKDEQELTRLLDEFDPATWPYDQAAVDDFNRRYNWDDVVAKYKKVLGLEDLPSGNSLTT